MHPVPLRKLGFLTMACSTPTTPSGPPATSAPPWAGRSGSHRGLTAGCATGCATRGLPCEQERLGRPRPRGGKMLNDSAVTANIPASDLDRARRFYADTLGLTPVSENPGGLVYSTAAGTWFFL